MATKPTLAEICQTHGIDMPEPDGWGRIKFVNPDKETEFAMFAMEDYKIDLNFWTHPQEREHVIFVKPK